MPAQTMTLTDSFTGPLITVYGNLVGDVPFTPAQATAANLTRAADVTGFARIRAFRIGSGRCVTLPIPTLIVVFGKGEELTETECGLAPGDVRKWMYPLGTQVLALEPSQGNAEEILEALAARGIEGGLAFENPRYENGKLCVDVHIWAKISILGASAKFDERFPICVNIGQQCLTVWDIGFANLQICYRAPNQICGKLCVGKFGIEKCWEQCVSIPIDFTASGASPNAHPCECSGNVNAPSPLLRTRGECVTLTISDGKACLNVPIFGSVCVSVPSSIPNGTLAEACIDICKRFGIPCGVEVTVKVAGQKVASDTWGCC
ncbi:MAG: hypothetical protein AABP62_11605 [Planctomycetota bacterium]